MAGCTEGPTQFKGYPQCPWWAHADDMLTHQRDDDGGETFVFEVMGQPAHGARTGGSHRGENDRVDSKRQHRTTEFARLVFEFFRAGGAHERIMRVGGFTDNGLLLQFAQAIARQHDVQVLLETGAIKIGRHVTAQDIAIVYRRSNGAITGFTGEHGAFTAHDKSGRRHDCNMPLRCGYRCGRCRIRIVRAIQTRDKAAFRFRDVG